MIKQNNFCQCDFCQQQLKAQLSYNGEKVLYQADGFVKVIEYADRLTVFLPEGQEDINDIQQLMESVEGAHWQLIELFDPHFDYWSYGAGKANLPILLPIHHYDDDWQKGDTTYSGPSYVYPHPEDQFFSDLFEKGELTFVKVYGDPFVWQPE